MNKLDRYIFLRMTVLTFGVLAVLIFVFIIIDFSENSDNFTDRGATFSDIWNRYYLNYIPEMIRLVSPMAVFVAVLLIVGQMTERMELTAIKASGVSLYRYMMPFLVFAVMITAAISYLDGFVIPGSNAERIQFEREYLANRSDRLDRQRIYRQDSPETLVTINYFDPNQNTAYQIRFVHFEGERLAMTIESPRMHWEDRTQTWRIIRPEYHIYNNAGYEKIIKAETDTTLNLRPRDIARTTSDIYQMTYPEILDYLSGLMRSGAAGTEMPRVQFYSKLTYPLGIIIISLIGLCIASVRRKGGKGVILGLGLTISFLYMAFMKIIEPFGSAGTIDPLYAAAIPHIIFFIISLIMLWQTPK